MYLAELELQGFKSFANKTRVKFDSGITAIVGPNGCGKSNIVDALRWVLGEQRPSLLRSAAMSNVIFNGSASKKALGMAEVSVTISNNRGILPTEFSEITMTRRLYRSGESEYLLNNKTCRLRDITDLFMDTGMGADAYSVIELKMVEEILNDKNNDRRKLFEEAAGITKYKERKKQTMKKLSDTRGDLQRMEDILVEVRKKVRSLQTQASRADRAHRYREELNFLDKAVSRFEYEAVKNELEPLIERISSASASREELGHRLENLEKSGQAAHAELLSREKTLGEVREKLGEAHRTLQERETFIRVTREKIRNEETVISAYEQDVYQAEKEIKDLRINLKVNEKELLEAGSISETARAKREQARELLEKSRSELAGIREELEKISRLHNETGRQVNELQSRQIRLESRLENGQEQMARLLKELAENDSKTAQLDQEKATLEGRHDDLADALEQAEQALEQNRIEYETLQESVQKQKDVIREHKSRRDAFASEYEMLKNLAESSDANPASVQFLQENRNTFAYLELVRDLFHTSESLSPAVEAALGEAADFLVVSDNDEAVQAFELLRKHQKGRVTTIPLKQVYGEFPIRDEALYHQIECAPEYEPLRALFFGEVLLASSLKEALELASQNHMPVVTRGGDVVSANGFLHSGSEHRNAGIRIGLREKIARRQANCQQAEKEVEKAELKLEDLNHSLNRFDRASVREKHRTALDALRKLEAQAESLRTRYEFFESSRAGQLNRRNELESTIAGMREELEDIAPERENLTAALQQVIGREMQLKGTLREKEEAFQRTQSLYNEAAIASENAQNHVDTLKREIGRFESNVQAIKDRLTERAERAKASKQLIIDLRDNIAEAEEKLQLIRNGAQSLQQERDELEEACSRQRGRINLLEQDIKDVRRKKEAGQELLHSLELARTRLEMDQKNITDHLWESYSITMDQVTEILPEDTDLSSARETIFTLKERLKNIGEVNPLAIAEYEEEKERLEHFESQIDDLEKAEKQLMQTIEEINSNARERFNTAFTAIRANFKTVFNTLFEETDHCDLVIDETAEDPLDAKIEIIAKPRGKRPSVIEQLSGGEKTLTAIALLFAIYLVKPSPFCVMDEVDAPLDDPNILRFTKLLKKFSNNTQFLVITHNKTTMEKAEMMYGVTMPESGVSKLVGVRLDEVAA